MKGMRANNAPYGVICGATWRFWVELGDDAAAVAERIIGDPVYLAGLAIEAKERLENGAKKIPKVQKIYFVGYDLAEQILGDSFISPTEVEASRLQVVYSDRQRRVLQEELPDQAGLKMLKQNGCFLIPSPPAYTGRAYWIQCNNVNVDEGWSWKVYSAVEEARSLCKPE